MRDDQEISVAIEAAMDALHDFITAIEKNQYKMVKDVNTNFTRVKEYIEKATALLEHHNNEFKANRALLEDHEVRIHKVEQYLKNNYYLDLPIKTKN